MPHLHYSPFQFATVEQVSDTNVSAKKIVQTLNKITRKDAKAVRNLDSTMLCSEAAMISGSPTAFISPNPIGTMKDIGMPMAAVGVAPPPKAAPAYDHSYRTRGRQGYGDRPAVMTKGDAMVY
jgi:hypothetical protein